jgi:hypothetical protein
MWQVPASIAVWLERLGSSVRGVIVNFLGYHGTLTIGRLVQKWSPFAASLLNRRFIVRGPSVVPPCGRVRDYDCFGQDIGHESECMEAEAMLLYPITPVWVDLEASIDPSNPSQLANDTEFHAYCLSVMFEEMLQEDGRSVPMVRLDGGKLHFVPLVFRKTADHNIEWIKVIWIRSTISDDRLRYLGACICRPAWNLENMEVCTRDKYMSNRFRIEYWYGGQWQAVRFVTKSTCSTFDAFHVSLSVWFHMLIYVYIWSYVSLDLCNYLSLALCSSRRTVHQADIPP